MRNNNTVQIIDIIKDDYQNFPQQTYSIYAEDVYFEDPLNKFTGLERYQKMIGFLSTFFQDINLDLHDISQQDREITIEWTLNMTSPLPWKPRLAIPGGTELKLNDENLIIVHRDRWKISRWQVLLQNFSRN